MKITVFSIPLLSCLWLTEKDFSTSLTFEPCKSIKGSHCEYCDYSAICQFDTSIKNNKYKIIANRKDKEVWEKIKEDVEGGVNL